LIRSRHGLSNGDQVAVHDCANEAACEMWRETCIPWSPALAFRDGSLCGESFQKALDRHVGFADVRWLSRALQKWLNPPKTARKNRGQKAQQGERPDWR